jgi:hypothetical protein
LWRLILMMMVSSLPMISTTSSPTRSIGNNDSHQIILIFLGLKQHYHHTYGNVQYIKGYNQNGFREIFDSYNFIIWLRNNFHQLKTNKNFNLMRINSLRFIQ